MNEIFRLVTTIIWISSQLILFYFTVLYEVALQLEMFSGVGSEEYGKSVTYSEVYVQMEMRYLSIFCYFCTLLRHTSTELFLKHF
jgi:hypothetical protein